MDSLGGGGDGYVGAGVDEELCVAVIESFEDASGEAGEVGGEKTSFAELDVVDAVGGPLGGLANEDVELCGQFRIHPRFSGRLREASEEGPICDGIAAHGVSVWELQPLGAMGRHRRHRVLKLL